MTDKEISQAVHDAAAEPTTSQRHDAIIRLMNFARIASINDYWLTCNKVGQAPSYQTLSEFQAGQQIGFARIHGPIDITKKEQ